MLELADLLGFIHITEDLIHTDYNLKKGLGIISSTVKDEIEAVGTKGELAKLPAGTVIVGNTFKTRKQPREIIYEQANNPSKAAKKKKSPSKSEFKLNKTDLIKPEIESICDNIYKHDTKNLQESKKGKKKIDRALCNICSKTYATRAYLKDHMTTHETTNSYKSESKKINPAERAPCNVCSKTFANKNILKTHMKLHDSPEHSICNICSKTSSSNIKLLVHMARKHGKKEYIVCANCGSNVSMTNMHRHQRFCKKSEEEKQEEKEKNQVECPECGKVLRNNTKLRRHIRFIHKQEKLFRCNHCDHEDYRKDNLRVHVKNCHGEADLDKSISNI